MVILPPSSRGALVVDANVMIALCTREAGRVGLVRQELAYYDALGYTNYAPGVIISETLYILCNKRATGITSASDYADAVRSFRHIMQRVLPPPSGDAALIFRAEQIVNSYGCSRSADGIYIALAEELAQTRPTVLLSFDQGMANQAARNAPTVIVRML